MRAVRAKEIGMTAYDDFRGKYREDRSSSGMIAARICNDRILFETMIATPQTQTAGRSVGISASEALKCYRETRKIGEETVCQKDSDLPPKETTKEKRQNGTAKKPDPERYKKYAKKAPVYEHIIRESVSKAERDFARRMYKKATGETYFGPEYSEKA